jgi:collagenase-like PrtC family protease
VEVCVLAIPVLVHAIPVLAVPAGAHAGAALYSNFFMIINTGVSNPHEIPSLARAGGNSFFFGLPGSCYTNLDQRPLGDGYRFDGFDDVDKAVLLAHEYQVTLSALVNLPRLTGSVFQSALAHIWALREHGLQWFVISNAGLIMAARQEFPEIKITLGISGQCNNTASAELYREMGVDRIVLDRFSGIDEIKAFTGAGFQVEVIVFFDRCLFFDATCRLPSFIKTQARTNQSRGCTCDSMGTELTATFNRRREDSACGFCYLKALEAAGVHSIKIASRGKPLEMKIRIVKAVNQLLTGPGTDISRKRCRDMYADLFHVPCQDSTCYSYV